MAEESPHSSTSPPPLRQEVAEALTPPPQLQPEQEASSNHHPTAASAVEPVSWPGISPPPPVRPLHPSPHSQSILLIPVPQAQKVSVVSPPYNFQTPFKIISSPPDTRRFLESPSGSNFLGFIVSLSDSVRGHKISDPCPSETEPAISSLLSLLQSLLLWIDDVPPVSNQSSRYGNVSYRTWHLRLSDSAQPLITDLLLRPSSFDPSAALELAPYLTDSFGNASRIDYGTGHETNFVAFLYCLARLGLVREEDYQAIVLRVFVKYLDLMRKLQTVYCLEPAGSHGVWGLDDYHFLPFIFGSSQLIDHKYMKPKSIHNQDILENFSHEYMYLSCIAFVKKVKKGIFAEHSPLLNDISGVPNWNKVNSGLLKMYRAEVLEKVPIMQHFLFGSLIKWE